MTGALNIHILVGVPLFVFFYLMLTEREHNNIEGKRATEFEYQPELGTISWRRSCNTGQIDALSP